MRLHSVVGIISTAILLSSCSGSDDPNRQNNKSEEAVAVPGYTGGCTEGFVIYTQRQFTGPNGGYGALVRSTLEGDGRAAGLQGNDKLTAVGWVATEEVLYPENPDGIQGRVWYYIPELPNGGAGWVADAGLRAVKTSPAPDNLSEYYDPEKQAAPRPSECELSR